VHYLPPEQLAQYAQQRLDELHREAERERRAREFLRARPGRSVRARVADGLYALAARIEGQPRRVSQEPVLAV